MESCAIKRPDILDPPKRTMKENEIKYLRIIIYDGDLNGYPAKNKMVTLFSAGSLTGNFVSSYMIVSDHHQSTFQYKFYRLSFQHFYSGRTSQTHTADKEGTKLQLSKYPTLKSYTIKLTS